MTNSTSTPGTKVGRARRTLGQLWQVPTFLVGLLAFIGVAVSAPWRPTPQSREFDEIVATLRQGLHAGESGDVLVAQADGLRLRLQRFPARAAEAQFLIGSAYYRQAQQKPAAQAKAIWPLAADHLGQALAAGGLEADKASLQYRLGYAMLQQNKETPRALELMTLGVEKGAEQPLEAYQLIVKTHLKQTPPAVDAALAAVRRLLDLTPERELEAIAKARLLHAELLMKKELRADAFKELERIGAKAPKALRQQARLLQARCAEEDSRWSKAIPLWQELLRESAPIEGGRARILYALGRCYQQIEPANHAETIRAWSEALQAGGPDGQAAGLHLGKLRIAMGGAEAARGLVDWKAALDKVNEPKEFANPHVAIEQLRTWFKQALDQFQEAQDPEKTQAVAELFRKVAPAGVAEMLRAEAAEAVAQKLADQLKAKVGPVTAAEVQAQYRIAAQAFEYAAEVRPEGERPEAVWRCAQCYLAAKDVAMAQQVLHQYVKIETKDVRLAEAWHTLGDLYRVQGDRTNAHKAYVKCIEIPNTPFAYRSRYYLAMEEYDKKNYEQAREIFRQTLESSTLDIDRGWQEKAIFKMASLLMDMKSYDEAHVHLKECLRHFPENQNAPQARLQLGECYRELAKKERQKEAALHNQLKPGLSDSDRARINEDIRHQRKMRQERVHESVKAFQQLADELQALSRKKQLTSHEQTLQRRAWLGIGECHLDDEEFPAALAVFLELQTKQRRTLEGFYASPFVCYAFDKIQHQSLPKQKIEQVRDSARESLRMLLEDLRALPKDHEIFKSRDVPPRDDWIRWAEETQRKLSAPAKVDRPMFP